MYFIGVTTFVGHISTGWEYSCLDGQYMSLVKKIRNKINERDSDAYFISLITLVVDDNTVSSVARLYPNVVNTHMYHPGINLSSCDWVKKLN